jgi:hypothetical protein
MTLRAPADHADSNSGGGDPSWTLLLPPPPQHDDSPHGGHLTSLARPSAAGPVLICLFLMVSYVGCSGALLAQLRGGSYLDSLFYCFMTILTIGHNNNAAAATGGPLWGDHGCGGGSGDQQEAAHLGSLLYILIGLILEATCLHILYEEVYLKAAAAGKGRGGRRPLGEVT